MTFPTETPPFLLLGQVLRPHGIRGELRVEVLTAYPERIVPEQLIYLGPNPADVSAARLYTVIQARRHQHYLILQLAGVSDRSAADLLREQYVMVALADAVPLEDDEYYFFQILGLDVITTEGEALGRITDVIETGANDVFVVRGPRGEVLLPVTDECVQRIDLDKGIVTVHLMAGLLGE